VDGSKEFHPGVKRYRIGDVCIGSVHRLISDMTLQRCERSRLSERSILMEKHLIEAISEGVATLTLNRPERLNALSTPIMDSLLEALPRLARDMAVGVVVLTGAGRAFCAGGDVKSMAEGSVERSMEDAVTHLRGRMEVSRLLHEIPNPTIAMVNGPAAGAGMSLALACDLRIAAQSARFVSAFANIGFSGDFGGSYFLSKLVGTGKAREVYYTSDPLDAAQALADIVSLARTNANWAIGGPLIRP
jgi:2-(1,2-epoxy-1,2-dihydrophenyl)acetyl-CoA isomerase